MKRRTKVQINYRSGHSMIVKCESCAIKHSNGNLTEIDIKYPDPYGLFVGIDDIESVWEL